MGVDVEVAEADHRSGHGWPSAHVSCIRLSARSNVVLPEPDGPMRAVTSWVCDFEGHVAHRDATGRRRLPRRPGLITASPTGDWVMASSGLCRQFVFRLRGSRASASVIVSPCAIWRP